VVILPVAAVVVAGAVVVVVAAEVVVEFAVTCPGREKAEDWIHSGEEEDKDTVQAWTGEAEWEREGKEEDGLFVLVVDNDANETNLGSDMDGEIDAPVERQNT